MKEKVKVARRNFRAALSNQVHTGLSAIQIAKAISYVTGLPVDAIIARVEVSH